MRYPREPVSKTKLIAWMLSGPLNLIVIGAAYLFSSLPGYFTVEDVRRDALILAASCSLGMALAIFRLRSAPATLSKIFLTVLKAAILMAAVTVIVVIVVAGINSMNHPSPDPFDVNEFIPALLYGTILIFLYSCFFFAIPAAIYGAVVLSLVGYESRPEG